MRAVSSPEFRNSKTRNSSGRKLGLSMNYLHLLFKGHTGESILDTDIDRKRIIQIGRYS